jgi:hypothetical protein
VEIFTVENSIEVNNNIYNAGFRIKRVATLLFCQLLILLTSISVLYFYRDNLSLKEIGLFCVIVAVTALIVSISILINLALAGEYLIEEGGGSLKNHSKKAEPNKSSHKGYSNELIWENYQGYIIGFIVIALAVAFLFHNVK